MLRGLHFGDVADVTELAEGGLKTAKTGRGSRPLLTVDKHSFR
jgi:hypothetical protein